MLPRFSKWVAKLSGKELVGKDKLGNSYFRKPHTNDSGVLTEKRWVEFSGDPEPTSVPVEWCRWLTYTRKDAPTPQEMLEKEMYRKNVQLKVALLQKEEEKRIFRVKSIQKEGVDMSPQSMERFLRQVSKQDEKGHGHNNDSSSSSTSSSEPSGTGDNFVPGKWRP